MTVYNVLRIHAARSSNETANNGYVSGPRPPITPEISRRIILVELSPLLRAEFVIWNLSKMKWG